MATLTELSALHGFAAGDINTDGYVAVIDAYQKIYYADGRDYDNKGYHKIDMINTKITGNADAKFTRGEAVTQASSGAAGVYDECTDIKLAGAITVASVPFQLGEKVTQLVTLAIGYVVYVGTGFINVCPVSRNPTTGAFIDFTASGNDVTGDTSGAVMATVDTVSAIGINRFHYIYRTTTTEFDQDNAITGLLSGAVLTPITAADDSPDLGACIQHLYPDASADSGTFTLTYEGETTAAIAYNASTATITTAIDLLSTVTAGDIVISGTTFDSGNSTTPLILTFLSTLGSVNSVTVTESMGTTTSVTTKILQTGFTTITAPPHWLTWKPVASWVDPEDSGTFVTNPGLMPDGGSNIGWLAFGRIFLNSMQNPHQWFCTRVNDPLDFDSSQTDIGAATTSQNQPKAGQVGQPIVAGVGYKDYYTVFGCTTSVFVMRGDPLANSINTRISESTGFFSPDSWCWDDQNNLYFLGNDGLYVLTSDAIQSAQPPLNITKDRMPKLISSIGLNRRTDRVAMEYDKQRYGIQVSVSQKDGAWSTLFWLDLRTGGVFPDSFPTGQIPASMLFYDSYKTTERGLLMAGYDGYIYKLDNDQKDDSGSNTIVSFFCTGPFVDDTNPRAKLTTNETSITLGEGSDGLKVDIFRADSGDELIKNVIDGDAPAATKTLTGDGLKSSMRARVTGRALGFRGGNSNASESFSMEGDIKELKQVGKQK